MLLQEYNLHELIKSGNNWHVGNKVGIVTICPEDFNSQSKHVNLHNEGGEHITRALFARSLKLYKGAIPIICNISPSSSGDLECTFKSTHYALTQNCECFLRQ